MLSERALQLPHLESIHSEATNSIIQMSGFMKVSDLDIPFQEESAFVGVLTEQL